LDSHALQYWQCDKIYNPTVGTFSSFRNAIIHRHTQYLDCYWFHFVPDGTAGIFHTGKQTGTIIPPIPPQVKFRPISRCSGHSGQFRQKYKFRPVPDFGFKKKNPTFFFFVTDPSSSFFFSSSSGGFGTLLLLFFSFWFFLLVCFGPAIFPFLFVCCTGNVCDYLSASLLFLKCYVLCFKIFICSTFASPHTLLFYHLCFKIWIFSLFCFCGLYVIKNKNECSNLNPLPLFQLLILTLLLPKYQMLMANQWTH